MKSKFIVGLLLALPLFAAAQKPEWATETYSRQLNMSMLQTIRVRGASIDEARQNAQKVVEDRRRATVGATDIWIKATPIAEYSEVEGGVPVNYFLYQMPNNPGLQIDEIESISVTDRHPISARALVPGMAQLHKGSRGKGIAFIAAEAAAIGGIVAFEGLRASNESKIGSTHNAKDRAKYIDNASNMQNIRNGFIAGAAAIYVWNVIDGMVAHGRQRVVVGAPRQTAYVPRVTPYATAQSAGMMFSLTF